MRDLFTKVYLTEIAGLKTTIIIFLNLVNNFGYYLANVCHDQIKNKIIEYFSE